MATDYTDKQIAEFERLREAGDPFPDGVLYSPAAFARGESVYRKMTAEDRRNLGLPPASAKAADEKED